MEAKLKSLFELLSEEGDVANAYQDPQSWVRAWNSIRTSVPEFVVDSPNVMSIPLQVIACLLQHDEFFRTQFLSSSKRREFIQLVREAQAAFIKAYSADKRLTDMFNACLRAPMPDPFEDGEEGEEEEDDDREERG